MGALARHTGACSMADDVIATLRRTRRNCVASQSAPVVGSPSTLPVERVPDNIDRIHLASDTLVPFW